MLSQQRAHLASPHTWQGGRPLCRRGKPEEGWGAGGATYRLVTPVSALVAEGALPEVDEVAVPGEEVGGAVDGQRHVDVHGHEVVVAVLVGPAVPRQPRRGVKEALDGADVVLPLRLGQVLPGAGAGERLATLPRRGRVPGNAHEGVGRHGRDLPVLPHAGPGQRTRPSFAVRGRRRRLERRRAAVLQLGQHRRGVLGRV